MTPEEAVDSSDAVLVLGSGPIYLEYADIPVIDVDRVWEAVANLSDAALGSSATGLAEGLTPTEASDAWSRTTLALSGYLRAIEPGAASNVLESASDYAEFAGTFSGIDSVYLSAYSSASRDLDLTGGSLERAAGLLDRYGIPDSAGGGAGQTYLNDVAHDHAALVNHWDLKSKLDQAHGNPFVIADVLAREAFGAAAGGAQSLIPGSGAYVKAAGDLLVTTAEGVVWGAGVGAGVGAFFGVGAAAVGAAVGAVIGGVVSLIGGIVALVTGSHATSDVAKGDSVPVSPPAPVTDQHGHTIRIGQDGHTAVGRPTGGSEAPPPPGAPLARRQRKCTARGATTNSARSWCFPRGAPTSR